MPIRPPPLLRPSRQAMRSASPPPPLPPSEQQVVEIFNQVRARVRIHIRIIIGQLRVMTVSAPPACLRVAKRCPSRLVPWQKRLQHCAEEMCAPAAAPPSAPQASYSVVNVVDVTIPTLKGGAQARLHQCPLSKHLRHNPPHHYPTNPPRRRSREGHGHTPLPAPAG